jgi:hypothetical protein
MQAVRRPRTIEACSLKEHMMRNGLALAGIGGGLLWISLAFIPPAGMRETRAYEVVWNRLWTPALVCMALGFFDLYRNFHPALSRATIRGLVTMLVGFAFMIAGNFTEYWLFSDLPHEGSDGLIRAVAWMTVLAGALLTLIAAVVTGMSMLYSTGISRWLSLVFILPLPLTIAIGFVSLNWAGTPIGFLSTIVGVFRLRTRMVSNKTAHRAEALE